MSKNPTSLIRQLNKERLEYQKTRNNQKRALIAKRCQELADEIKKAKAEKVS